jgi:hypothetical protein
VALAILREIKLPRGRKQKDFFIKNFSDQITCKRRKQKTSFFFLGLFICLKTILLYFVVLFFLVSDLFPVIFKRAKKTLMIFRKKWLRAKMNFNFKKRRLFFSLRRSFRLCLPARKKETSLKEERED